ncbi:calcium/sodium antiporter [Alteribacillus sp. HJP-4]|uniref:calcium/sodium antiporter n=1 Tax=Alteribacillus sp. HJP-4 TaxID=2775394 RepID=UPI0035CD33DD
MTYILLLIGFALLIKGADLFVDGASSIAGLLRVPPLLIGLTIVAFGTSSPEATVSMIAAAQGTTEVALGNVVGSNIFNITLVAGLTAFLFPLKVETETIRKEIPFTFLASTALLIMMSDVLLQGEVNTNIISRADGFIFLLFFTIFLYYIYEVARNSRGNNTAAPSTVTEKKWSRHVLFTLGGLAAIIFGGDLVVRNSTEIAYTFGMSETLVGLTIVAVGTSLPELVTSITAAVKKQSELALGNIIGSNIFNILFVLGASAVISDLVVNSKVFLDVGLMLLLTLVLLLFSKTNYRVGKYEGMMLAGFYVVYLVYIILRN